MPVHALVATADQDAVAALSAALADALAGGPTVLPVPAEVLPATALRAVADSAASDGAALLVPTSGSTGTPKLVSLSAAALTTSATGTELALAGPGHWLLALPTTHVAGLQVLLRSLAAGTTPVVHGPGGFEVARFAAATDLLAGTPRYTALVPTQLRRLLDSDVGRAALSTYDAVLVGGAATPPPLLAAARRAGVTVRTTYGMSETAGGCLYDGVPIPGAAFDVDRTGRIGLGGGTLAAGYHGDPAATAAAFVDGWFLTSDLGRVDGSGALQVLGRVDDVVISGGVNVHPLAVEAVVADLPGVLDVCVAGVPDDEWGAVVTAWVVGDVGHDAVRAAVRERLGPAAAPRATIRVDAIPLLVSGKPDRRRLVATLATP